MHSLDREKGAKLGHMLDLAMVDKLNRILFCIWLLEKDLFFCVKKILKIFSSKMAS